MTRMLFSSVLLLILSGSFTSLQAQLINRVVVDERIKREVLLGSCDRDGLMLPQFETFYFQQYKQYEPDSQFVEKLKEINPDWHVVIILGTWCGDSQREVPRFFRIMDECGFPDRMISMYGVGRDKTAGDVDISGWEVTHVPTFIFYSKNREIGRIVESPMSALEKDMLVILSRTKPLEPKVE